MLSLNYAAVSFLVSLKHDAHFWISSHSAKRSLYTFFLERETIDQVSSCCCCPLAQALKLDIVMSVWGVFGFAFHVFAVLILTINPIVSRPKRIEDKSKKSA